MNDFAGSLPHSWAARCSNRHQRCPAPQTAWGSSKATASVGAMQNPCLWLCTTSDLAELSSAYRPNCSKCETPTNSRTHPQLHEPNAQFCAASRSDLAAVKRAPIRQLV
jgi:hypothetical protein